MWVPPACALTLDNPGRTELGLPTLLGIVDGRPRLAGQGLVFAADSRHLLVQYNVEEAIAVLDVADGGLTDTGLRVALPGGPTSIR